MIFADFLKASTRGKFEPIRSGYKKENKNNECSNISEVKKIEDM